LEHVPEKSVNFSGTCSNGAELIDMEGMLPQSLYTRKSECLMTAYHSACQSRGAIQFICDLLDRARIEAKDKGSEEFSPN
jgi:hypothetical protein